MVFSSIEFICLFMPAFFLMYYLAPYKYKNIVLLFGSLCFYAVGTINYPIHFILFIISLVVDYACGVFIIDKPKYKKVFLTCGIMMHMLVLFYFKYSGFVFGELGKRIAFLDIDISPVLPIGISFYTFQGVSYIVDVYRGTVEVERNILNYGVYISMFEQLIAGPIVTYSQVRKELRNRRIEFRNVMTGVAIFIFGLGFKVLLANQLGGLWSDVTTIGYDSISTPLAWMAIIAYSLQLYFDFWGYSLMAIGIGKMLGFNIPKNFDFPYLSLTMTEFWRRWHITLGSWFREYVYIPLGGNRQGKFKHIRNLFVVWLLTGVWHGAGYNFALWGIVLFIILLVEKYCTGKFFNKYPVVGHIYMILLIPITWTVFVIENIGQMGVFFSRLFPFFGQGVWSVFRHDYIKYWNNYWMFILIGIILCMRWPFNLLKKIKNVVIITVICLAILAASVYCMYMGLDDPFLYFRF
ncbi:MAG: MBOAT family protein [Lachnospiraceae bacterium]|nr:MBOAT family protein [Lachnospiraceae bacterium]